MSSVSEVGIINIAYARIGSGSIQSVEADSKARLAYTLYKSIRNRYQAAFPWNFCQSIAELNAVAEEDQAEAVNNYLGTEYVLPSDCIRPLDLFPLGGATKWQVIGMLFITHALDPVLLYSRLITSSGSFPDWFIDALSSRLAMELVPRNIGTKEALRTDLRNEALVAWNEATEIDANIGNFVREAGDEYDRSTYVMPEGTTDDDDVSARWQT